MINPGYQYRIVRDPKRCGGERTIRGTRVTVRVILASLAEGDRPEEVVQAFPSLCLEDVQAAIEFSAEYQDENVSEKAVEEWHRSFVVVTERKLRVMRPN